MPVPTIGRIVRYKLTQEQADQVNRRRTDGASIADRIGQDKWPIGAQAHIGNKVEQGDVFPMLVVRTWGNDENSAVNGQVFLDGNDVLWATSVVEGPHNGMFEWPKVR